jgi:diadenosine tetraphosphate (Ap4A) HIT family hydrolase
MRGQSKLSLGLKTGHETNVRKMVGCKLCEMDGGELIWSDNQLRVVQVEDPKLPGFVRVIWSEHIAEMSDLKSADQLKLMKVVFGLEQLIRRHMEPTKVNLASLGNQVAHVHWHVIPRFHDDAFFPDSIWSSQHRSTDEQVLTERASLAAKLPNLIQQQSVEWVN